MHKIFTGAVVWKYYMVFGNATTSLFEGLWLFLCERIILIWLRGLILYFRCFCPIYWWVSVLNGHIEIYLIILPIVLASIGRTDLYNFFGKFCP